MTIRRDYRLKDVVYMSDDDPLLQLLQRPKGINMSPEALFVSGRRHFEHMEHGFFMWTNMFGKQLPSICIGGESSIPFDILIDIVEREPTYHEESFGELMKQKNVYMKLATSVQVEILQQNCEQCRKLNPVNLRLLRRSDIERLIGSLRIQSGKCPRENDIWNHAERFRIAHFNFSDSHDDLFENDSLEEDFCAIGTCGWFYPSRKGMRCIICCECQKPFTPPDFVLHHHFVEKVEGLFHFGLNSNNWPRMLTPTGPETSREHQIAWNIFTEVDGAPGLKRRHEFSPAIRKDLVDIELLNKVSTTKKKLKYIDVVGDGEYDDDDDDDGDDDNNDNTVIDRDLDIAKSKAKAKEMPLDNIPCSSSKLIGSDNLYYSLIANLKDKLPALFVNPAHSNMWAVPKLPSPSVFPTSFEISKMDLKNIVLPKFAATSELPPKMLPVMPKALPEYPPKFDLQKTYSGFSHVDQEKVRNVNTTYFDSGWDAVKREQKFLQTLPDETVRLLDNKTIEPSMIFLASSFLHSK